MMLFQRVVASRKGWCACFFFAALPVAMIRVLFMFSSSKYPNFGMQTVSIPKDPALNGTPTHTPTHTPSPASKVAKCDLSQGDWMPDHAAPAYDNQTCWYIQDTQNCLRNGRQDSRYLYWKWKPRGCEILRGNPKAFLESMHGQKLAFIGDSIARNQMQSLLCILSQVEKPINTFHDEEDKTNYWFFQSYSFTLTIFWSPFLVKHSTFSIQGTDSTIMELDLDVLDTWVESMASTDVLVISSGQWYFKKAVYKEDGQIIGCHYCGVDGFKQIGYFSAYRRALKTVLKGIVTLPGFDGTVVFRTFAPDHFENGGWDTGGTCPRTVPGGVAITEANWMMHEVEVTALEIVKAEADRVPLILLDITEQAQVRSDGHPGPYRNPYPFAKDAKETFQIDCLHWCLPGPIDTWNEMLMETLQH